MLKKLIKCICFLLVFVLANSLLKYEIGNLGYLSINLLLILLWSRYIQTNYFILLISLASLICSFFSPLNIVGYVAIVITILVGLLYAIFQNKFKYKYISLAVFSLIYLLLMVGKDAVFFGFDIIMVSIKYHVIETSVNLVLAVLFTYLLDKKK